MDTLSSETEQDLVLTRRSRKPVYAVLVLLVLVGALVTYKAAAALAVIQKVESTGTLQPRTNVLPLPGNGLQLNVFTRTINYFLVVAPALLFGILISGAARVFISPLRWTQVLGSGHVRPQLVAGAAGVPLMLCSCCAAPIFSTMYERSGRLGASLATILAAPSLNPAALILTFLLFDSRIAITRLVMAGLAVFLTATVTDRLFSTRLKACAVDYQESEQPVWIAFLRSSLQVAMRTVPLIIVGVLISMLIAFWLPASAFASPGGAMAAFVAIALFAVLLAMPTFFEIPLALILLTAGAPPAAAVAMLIAGPAINLPSLLTIARTTNWKVALTVGSFIFLLAIAGGLLVSIL